jgi:hypothetical protein
MSQSQVNYRHDDYRTEDRRGDPARTRHPMIFPAIAGAAVVSVLIMWVLENAFN